MGPYYDTAVIERLQHRPARDRNRMVHDQPPTLPHAAGMTLTVLAVLGVFSV